MDAAVIITIIQQSCYAKTTPKINPTQPPREPRHAGSCEKMPVRRRLLFAVISARGGQAIMKPNPCLEPDQPEFDSQNYASFGCVMILKKCLL